MLSGICFKTVNENHYFFDAGQKLIFPIHPLIGWYYEQERRGIRNDPVNDEDNALLGYSDSELNFYYKEFLFLKQNGLFNTKKQSAMANRPFTSEMVKHELANLRQVVFEVTDACNLKCKYCGYGEFYEDYDNRNNRFMDFNTAKLVIDYLVKLVDSPLNQSYNKNIYFSFYGGEPLMNISLIKKTIAYVEALPSQYTHFSFAMTTNAVLLDKYMDYLVEKDFTLLISLDGTAENHSYRVFHDNNNSFKKVFNNVKLLMFKYPVFFEKSVSFNTVLHNRNSVGEVKEFIEKEFDKTPTISELNFSGIKKEKRKEFLEVFRNIEDSLSEIEDYDTIADELFANIPDINNLIFFVHDNTRNIFRDYNDFFIDQSKVTRMTSGTCFPFSRKFFVTVNGKILPCERIGHQYALGYVSGNEIELDPKMISEKYNQYYNKLNQQCENCYNADNCLQCMFNLDDLDGEPVCIGFMNMKQYGKYLSARLSYLENHPHVYRRIFEEVTIE